MKNDGKITFFGLSDMGRQRTNNEDAFVAEALDENTVLAVAIDGVGGYEGGEVAAAIAQKEIPEYLKKYNRGERLELLKQAVTEANNAIVERRQTDTERANMSCVLTSAVFDIQRKVVDMVHVGDTRLYQFHLGQLRKLSHDHSLVGYREEIGDLTEEEAMHHPKRNEISRDVGSEWHEVEDRDFIEAEEFPLPANSIFLFCSDGLTDLVTSKQIVGILELPDSLEKKAQMLIDMANEAGGKDNITVVLVEYHAEEEKEEAPLKPVEEQNAAETKGETSQPTGTPVHLPVQNDEEKNKKRGKKSKLIWIIVLVALFLGICVFIALLRESNRNTPMDEVDPCEATIEDDSALDEDADRLNNETIDPWTVVSLYSRAVEENDFKTISHMFADTAFQYCNAKMLTNEEVVKRHKAYDERFHVTRKILNIRKETVRSMPLPDGGTFVVYIEDLELERQNLDLPDRFVVAKYIILDENYKIVSLEDVTVEGNFSEQVAEQ